MDLSGTVWNGCFRRTFLGTFGELSDPEAGTDSLVVQGAPAEVFNIGRSAMPRAELIALRSVIRLIEWLLQVDFTSVKKIYKSYRDLNHRYRGWNSRSNLSLWLISYHSAETSLVPD